MLGILKKLDFLRNLFGADPSATRAKERLRIVLIQDQSSISPKLLDVLRHEMIGVVSRYLEIDLHHLEMGIQRKESAIALAANIPIVRIRKEGRALVAQSEYREEEDARSAQSSRPSVEKPVEAAITAGASGNSPSKGERRQRRGRRHLR